MRENNILTKAADFGYDSDISDMESTTNSLDTFRNTDDERESPVFLRAKRHLPGLNKK